MSNRAIMVDNVSKCFKVYSNPWHRAAEWGGLGMLKMHEEFWALKNISFQVDKGECLGIIGANGAGKSTLLKILTGTLSPTSGQLNIKGNVLSLLELGTGFNMQLTGRQNLFNSARLMGFPDSQMAGRINEIEEFSELGDFFDMPIQTYSSGMYVRLAFSMFVNMQPQVLIIDEALSVGDVFFQQKSFARMREIIKSGTTCIFVSHDMSAVQNLCGVAILLNNGEIAFTGEPQEAVSRYYTTVGKRSVSSIRTRPAGTLPPSDTEHPISSSDIMKHNILNDRKRHGAGGVRIIAARITDDKGHDTMQVEMLKGLAFHILIEAYEDIHAPNVGIQIYDRFGNLIFAAGARQRGYFLPDITCGQKVVVRLDIAFNIHIGEYTFSLGVGEPAADEGPNSGFTHDRHEMLGPITVTADTTTTLPFYGITQMPMKVTHFPIIDEYVETGKRA